MVPSYNVIEWVNITNGILDWLLERMILVFKTLILLFTYVYVLLARQNVALMWKMESVLTFDSFLLFSMREKHDFKKKNKQLSYISLYSLIFYMYLLIT